MFKRVFTFISLIILTNITAQNINAGLVAYFPFSGNTNDESTYNLNGIGNNLTPGQDVIGNPNKAYIFNGINSRIDAGYDNRGVQDTIVISAWIKSTMSNTDYGWIAGKYDWRVDRGYHIALKNGHVFIGGRNTSSQYVRATAPDFQNDGKWHHIMGVIKGNTWEIWVDCELKATTYSINNPQITTTQVPLNIGHYTLGDSGNHRYFNGVIDDVRIYNRALIPQEINQLCSIDFVASNKEDEKDSLPKITMNIFPNPTKNEFYIELNYLIQEKASLKIFDVSGKLLLTKSFNQNETIDVSGFHKGTYLVRVTLNNTTLTKRLIID